MTFRHSVFEVRPSTWPAQYGDKARDAAVQRIIETIDASTFPWSRCAVGLRNSGKLPFPIEFMDPKDGAVGYVSNRRMWLKPDWWGLPTYQTIAHELAHVADLSTLGVHRDRPWFNSSMSPWRTQLLNAATWNGTDEPPSQFWQPGRLTGATWAENPIEAVTVPFTRAFWTDPKYHYPRNPFLNTWTWGDVGAVRTIFLARGIEMFSDVPKSHTHAEAIKRQAERKIIEGFTNGQYRPQDSVTRGQLASIIDRTIEHVHKLIKNAQ